MNIDKFMFMIYSMENTYTLEDMINIIRYYHEAYIDNVNELLKDKYKNNINKFNIISQSFYNNLIRLNNPNCNEEIEIYDCCLKLGSLLESVLQIFLMVFEEDYNKLNWKKWDQSVVEKIQNRLRGTLTNLRDEKIITTEQRTAIKELLDNELKIRKNGKPIDRIMLDELIAIFKISNILMDDTGLIYSQMETIRDSRNNIHVFTKKGLPDKDKLIELLGNYVYIINDLGFRVISYLEDNKDKVKSL